MSQKQLTLDEILEEKQRIADELQRVADAIRLIEGYCKGGKVIVIYDNCDGERDGKQGHNGVHRGQPGKKLSNRAKVAEVARGRWVSVQEIAEATGLTKKQIHGAMLTEEGGYEYEKRAAPDGQLGELEYRLIEATAKT